MLKTSKTLKFISSWNREGNVAISCSAKRRKNSYRSLMGSEAMLFFSYLFPPGGFLLGVHLLHWLISVSLVGLLRDLLVGFLAPPGAGWILANLRIGDVALLRGPHLRSPGGVVQRVGAELLPILSRRIWCGAAPLWVVDWAGGLQRSRWVRWRRTAGLFISVAVQSPWSSAPVHLSLLWLLRPVWIKTSQLSLVPLCGSSGTRWSFRTNLGHVWMWRKRRVQQWFQKAISTDAPVLPVWGQPYLWTRLLSASCFYTSAAAPAVESASHSAADFVVSWQARWDRRVSGPKGSAGRGRWLQTSYCSPHRTAHRRLPGHESGCCLSSVWDFRLTQTGLDRGTLPSQSQGQRLGRATHLETAGRQVFPERLDGAELVKLNQLRQTVVRSTVSSHRELTPLVLDDDKMAAPVVAPSKENHNQKIEGRGAEGTHSLVGQDVSDGFIAEADKEAAQRFIFQQIFSLPDGHDQTDPFLDARLNLIYIYFKTTLLNGVRSV